MYIPWAVLVLLIPSPAASFCMSDTCSASWSRSSSTTMAGWWRAASSLTSFSFFLSASILFPIDRKNETNYTTCYQRSQNLQKGTIQQWHLYTQVFPASFLWDQHTILSQPTHAHGYAYTAHNSSTVAPTRTHCYLASMYGNEIFIMLFTPVLSQVWC